MREILKIQVIPRDLRQRIFLEEVSSVKALKWKYLWQSSHDKNAREVETHGVWRDEAVLGLESVPRIGSFSVQEATGAL